MPFIVAGLIVVFVLCAANLLLMFGVIRRLRQHTGLLCDEGTRILPAKDPTVAVGSSPDRFAVSALNGTPVSSELIAGGRTIVAFFAPDCSSCETSTKDFTEG